MLAAVVAVALLSFVLPVDATSWYCRDAYWDRDCTTPGEAKDCNVFFHADNHPPFSHGRVYERDVWSFLFLIESSGTTRCIPAGSCVWTGFHQKACNKQDLSMGRISKDQCAREDRLHKYSEEHCKELGMMDVPDTEEPPSGGWCSSVWMKRSCSHGGTPSSSNFLDTKCETDFYNTQIDNVINTTECQQRTRWTSGAAVFYKSRCSESDDTSPPTKHYNLAFFIFLVICVFCCSSCGYVFCWSVCFKSKAQARDAAARGVTTSNDAGTELMGRARQAAPAAPAS